jgi:hypothetical protein
MSEITSSQFTDVAATWGFVARVVVKAAFVLVVCNFTYALIPTGAIDRLSLHNSIVPGRERFPIGTADEFTQTVYSLDALFASHEVSSLSRDRDGEYRVFLLGDSATWGYLLAPDDTYSANITARGARLPDGRRVVAYNLAYQRTTAMRDLLVLDYALQYEPDMIVWLVTARTFLEKRQPHELLDANPARTDALLTRFDLTVDDFADEVPRVSANGPLLANIDHLSDLFRLQLMGVPWAVTRMDHNLAQIYEPLQNDFEERVGFESFDEPQPVPDDFYRLDVMSSLSELAEGIPLLVVNEPMFIADGENSDLHYNAMYPRWVYDQYRQMMFALAGANRWSYVDYWDAVPADEFTNTDLHITAGAAAAFSDQLLEDILEFSMTNK